jgi:hypothetical protein
MAAARSRAHPSGQRLDPETIQAWEISSKSRFFNNHRQVKDRQSECCELQLQPYAGAHGHPRVLTLEQVDELLRGGTERAGQMCADWLAKGYYLAGCPVWSKRYGSA